MLYWLELIGGMVLLGLGAEWLVRGAGRLALAAGLTPLVIGLTVVAFGTSAPELVTSIVASASGESTLALANVIGSNIGNLGLILAISACIRSLPVQSQLLRRDLPGMVLVTGLFFILLKQQVFGPVAGALFVVLLIGFIVHQIRTSRLEPAMVIEEYAAEVEAIEGEALQWPLSIAAAVTVAGLVVLVVGGTLLVNSAVAIAQAAGISERVIGLTIVAIGTSLPELATTIVAVMRNEPDVAVGNVIGSCIFNLLGIGGIIGLLGRTASLAPGTSTDLWVLLGVTFFAAILLWTERTLTRREGVSLLFGYIAYLIWLLAS